MMTQLFAGQSKYFYCSVSVLALPALLLSLYTVVRAFKRRKPQFIIPAFAAQACQFIIYEAALNEMLFIHLNDPDFHKRKLALVLEPLENHVIFTVLVLTSAVSFTVFFLLIRNERHSISVNSVKEGMDILPAGLCCYTPDGIPKLVNRTMNSISFELSGNALMNGILFEKAVFDFPDAVPLPEGGVAIKTESGKTYGFTRSKISTNTYPELKLITAVDISEQMELKAELEKKNSELTEINNRIHAISEQIVGTTIQKELLIHKTAIHNNLGELLLKTTAQLDSGSFDAGELVSLWKDNITLYAINAAPSGSDRYELMKKVASDVGLKLEITGELPQENPAKNIIASAMHQCMTNTICHAGGKTVFIDVRQEPRLITAVFTNDGLPPQGEIKEGTGLTQIRTLTEQAGGIMTVDASPRFTLTLTIPK